MVSKILKYSLMVVISAVLTGFLLANTNISDIIETFKKLPAAYIIAAFAIYFLSGVFRATRISALIEKKIRFVTLLKIMFVHNMFNNLLPAKTGELSFLYLTKKTKKISMMQSAVSLLTARVLDLISLSVLFIISTLFIKEVPQFARNTTAAISIMLLAMIILMMIIIRHHKKVKNCLEKKNPKNRILKKIFSKVNLLFEELDRLKSARKLLTATGFSFLVWICTIAQIYLIFLATGNRLNLWIIILGATFLKLMSVLPIYGLAGFGTTEGFWSLAFISMSVAKEIAINTGFVIHIITLTFAVILGVIGYFLLKNEDIKDKKVLQPAL